MANNNKTISERLLKRIKDFNTHKKYPNDFLLNKISNFKMDTPEAENK